MKIRTRLVWLLFFLTLIFMSVFIVQRNYEQNRVISLLKSVQVERELIFDKVLDLKEAPLLTFSYDYSFWDEMVNFVTAPNEKWALENISVGLATFKSNAAWVYNVDRQLVYSVNNLEEAIGLKEIPIPKAAISGLFAHTPFCHFFVNTSKGLMEFYGATIQPSSDVKRETPAKGYFFCSRLWDKSYIDDLSEITSSKLVIADTVESRLHKSGQNAVSFLRVLTGWDNKPVKYLVISAVSQAIEDTKRAAAKFTLLFISFSVITIVIVCFFITFWVYIPLKLISQALKKGEYAPLKMIEKQRTEFGDISRLMDNFFTQRVRIIQEIAERKLAEEALRDSEVSFRSIFDNANDGILLADEATKKFYIGNNTACQMLGYSLEEIKKLGVTDIHPEEGLPYVMEQFEKQVRREIAVAKDLPVKRKDGSVFYADVNTSLVTLAGRTYLLGIFRDITEQKKTQEMLQKSEEQFRALFEGSRDAIMILEPPSWKFTSGNQATVEMFRVKKEEEFISFGPWTLSPQRQPDGSASAEKAKEMIEMAMRDGSNFFEWTHKRLDGEEFPATVLLTRMEYGGKAVLQATVRDISIQKQAEREREKILQWQQDVAVLQQSLLASASLESKLKVITDSIVRIFDVDFCRIWLIRPGDLCGQGCIHAEVSEGPHVCRYRDKCLHLLASSGRYTHIDGKVHARVPFDCYKIGRVASSKDHKFLTNDVVNDPRVHNHEWARELGLVSFVGYQLRVPNGETIGVLALFAKHPILPTEDTILDSLSTTTAFITQQAVMDKNLERQTQELDGSLKEALKSHEILASMLADNNQIREELEQRIEELKATYSKLKDVQSQLIQSSKMSALGQLASGVAHEINNPLTGVLNNVQLIKMEAEASKDFSISDFKELLDIVESSALRCKKITQSLLDFSHAAIGKFLPLSLNSIVEEVISIIKQELLLGNIEINKELQPDLPKITGDPQLLAQVILGLFNNAKWAIGKKSKEGGSITIKTEDEPEAKIIKISVSDTGIGILQANIPKLFTPFFTTKDVGEGTGLGLAVIYNIIKSHNGDIVVKSRVGVGTTFTITLPYI